MRDLAEHDPIARSAGPAPRWRMIESSQRAGDEIL
jgi:hypothetical protein